jgi:hypothetical protein
MKNTKKFGRMINQAKLRNLRRQPVYKYGDQVPRDHQEAVFIGQKNGNTGPLAGSLFLSRTVVYVCF